MSFFDPKTGVFGPENVFPPESDILAKPSCICWKNRANLTIKGMFEDRSEAL